MEWISVKDRLPENSDEVICLFTGWDDMRCYRTLSFDKEYMIWFNWSGLEYITVTHWMPLPEPPNE